MTKKLASNVSLKVQLATFFMATVCAAVSAIIVLTLIGSSVMDATHLILISPYLKISYSSYSLLRNIFNFQCLYLYNIYKHNTIKRRKKQEKLVRDTNKPELSRRHSHIELAAKKHC